MVSTSSCVVTNEMVLCFGNYVLLIMMKEQSHFDYLQCFISYLILSPMLHNIAELHKNPMLYNISELHNSLRFQYI